jgi:hypothetical protein
VPVAASDVLADLAEAVLYAALEGLADDGVTAPARRFVHGGPAQTLAWDCDLVAVNLETLEPGGRVGAPGQRNTPPRGAVQPLTAVYVTHVVVCYPTVERDGTGSPTIPDAAVESAAARELLATGFSARRGVVARVLAGTLAELQPDDPDDQRTIGYERSEVGPLQPHPRSPSGGMAGMTFTTRLRL